MKNYFFSTLAIGILLAVLTAATVPVYSSDPQQKQRKTDTASDTRMIRNNYPEIPKTDSLPAPVPVPRALPDTIPAKNRR